MMSWIFGGMMVMGVTCSLFLGRGEAAGSAILASGGTAAAMCLELLGTVCIWSGIMSIAKGAGLCDVIAKILRPVISFLFPGLKEKSGKAVKAISMNLTANLLGLGSAATPSALEAIRELDRVNPDPYSASDHMVVLTALNTASFQLIPATVAAIRTAAGSERPLEILPAVWVSSAVSVVLAVGTAKLISKVRDCRSK